MPVSTNLSLVSLVVYFYYYFFCYASIYICYERLKGPSLPRVCQRERERERHRAHTTIFR